MPQSNSGTESPALEAEKLEVMQLEWAPEDESRIRRKLDWRILPLIGILYVLWLINRMSIGIARIQGLEKNLNMVGSVRFNWALATFYFSFIAVEYPSKLLLRVLEAKYYLPLLALGYGIVSMCTGFVNNYAGLVACRFFLGVAEGGLMPGIALYLSCFYRQQELIIRIGILSSGSSLGGAFGGFIAAGLCEIPRWGIPGTPIYGWRRIFVYEGIMTLLFAALAVFCLPSNPEQCRFLSSRERHVALERITREQKEKDQAQAKITLGDITAGVCNFNSLICGFGALFASISAQSLSLFVPTMLHALGWTALKTQLLSNPPFAVACLWSFAVFWLSNRLKRPGFFCAFNAALSMAGYCIVVTAHLDAIKYLGLFFAASGSFPNGPGFLSWGMSDAVGSKSRAVTSGYIIAMSNLGAMIATWTYLPHDAHTYSRGHYVNVAAEALVLLLSLLGILYAKWENGKRESGARDHRLVGLTGEQVEKLGHKHPSFRYVC